MGFCVCVMYADFCVSAHARHSHSLRRRRRRQTIVCDTRTLHANIFKNKHTGCVCFCAIARVRVCVCAQRDACKILISSLRPRTPEVLTRVTAAQLPQPICTSIAVHINTFAFGVPLTPPPKNRFYMAARSALHRANTPIPTAAAAPPRTEPPSSCVPN